MAAVGRKFNVNESTIRTIRTNKDNIRKSGSDLGTQAKFNKVVRNENLLKMEDLLVIWIQDVIYKRILLDSKSIRQQAIDFYNHFYIEEMVNQEIKEDPKESQENPEKDFHSRNLINIINSIQNAIDEAMGQDPIMTRCLRFKHNCNLTLQVYEELYKDYIRQLKETQITDFLRPE